MNRIHEGFFFFFFFLVRRIDFLRFITYRKNAWIHLFPSISGVHTERLISDCRSWTLILITEWRSKLSLTGLTAS